MIALALMACGAGTVTLSTDSPACENWDFDNPEDPSLVVSMDGSRIVVQRVGVYQPEDAVFDPDIIAEGNTIAVYEAWTSAEGGDPDYCYSPVVFADPERAAEFSIEWFAAGENTPTHTREIDARE
ncbi:MAG: hypothetical protein GY913_19775 [Proteobacteria bacterium]|nr:hypothetical protein [Pseudomonadota bacterium]MCP4919148.1 hypothetical protein [Pseudomonadota bacterium]